MTFSDAVAQQMTTTTNGMPAFAQSLNANLDYFYRAPAMRRQDIIPLFLAAYVEEREVALRITQWLRDVRGGSGERELFRQVLRFLEEHDRDAARALMHQIPEIGRWDDVLVFERSLKHEAFDFIVRALHAGDRLCAKWMPRQGAKAAELHRYLGWSPKRWRKMLVGLSSVVEHQMCRGDWDEIEFAKVPSVASARYRNAFLRHTPKFTEYVAALANGETTIHAGAVYPYDLLKNISTSLEQTERDHIVAQWAALPNFVGDAMLLPMVDVSGSMDSPISQSLTCMGVAISLGLYLADKNVGPFKDTFLTFSTQPELLRLKGNVIEKYFQMQRANWNMSTNIEAAFDLILSTALSHAVPQAQMPQILLILSDMQFDASHHGAQVQRHRMQTAFEMVAAKYRMAGYVMPQVVFWNLNGAYKNVPVRFDTHGVAMVSGFSPAILDAILKADFDHLSPENVMRAAVMKERYALPDITSAR
jgi:hypothetical protein